MAFSEIPESVENANSLKLSRDGTGGINVAGWNTHPYREFVR